MGNDFKVWKKEFYHCVNWRWRQVVFSNTKTLNFRQIFCLKIVSIFYHLIFLWMKFKLNVNIVTAGNYKSFQITIETLILWSEMQKILLCLNYRRLSLICRSADREKICFQDSNWYKYKTWFNSSGKTWSMYQKEPFIRETRHFGSNVMNLRHGQMTKFSC